MGYGDFWLKRLKLFCELDVFLGKKVFVREENYGFFVLLEAF